jgi:hypothetical protein
MSHQERNGVRAAYIHKAEFLDERKLMLQWWADFLDANSENPVSPRLRQTTIIIYSPGRNAGRMFTYSFPVYIYSQRG